MIQLSEKNELRSMLDLLVKFIENKGGQLTTFVLNEYSNFRDDYCWVATELDDSDFDDMDLVTELDYSKNFFVGVSEYLVRHEIKIAVMGVLHEIGHAIDLETVSYNMRRYNSKWPTLEYELRAWENGWEIAKLINFTDIEAYREYCRNCYMTYWNSMKRSFWNHNRNKLTIEEVEERISKIGLTD